MGRYSESRCSVCRSKHAGVIDVALVAGRSASSLAKQYGLGKDSVNRHRNNCLPDRLARVQEAQEIEVLSDTQLIAEVQRVKARAEDLCDEAELSGEIRERASALRELRQVVELLAKLTFAAADRQRPAYEEDRPDIDALILKHVAPDSASSSDGHMVKALEAPPIIDDDVVVEAEVIDG